jgi:hypothetical protein
MKMAKYSQKMSVQDLNLMIKEVSEIEFKERGYISYGFEIGLPNQVNRWVTKNKVISFTLTETEDLSFVLNPVHAEEKISKQCWTFLGKTATFVSTWVTNHYQNIIENKEEKGDDEMKGFNLEFGNCEKKAIKMSPYGIAVKNGDQSWVAYDKNTGDIIDVDIFNFDCGRYLYRVPVAITDIAAGDVIIHNRYAMFVTEVLENSLKVIDPAAGENKEIILTKNMFGFNFATKIISLFDNFGGIAADKDNPFGNMLPFLMMGESDDQKFDPMMMCLLMNKGTLDMNNPLMLMALCGNDNNMLPMLALMGGLNK